MQNQLKHIVVTCVFVVFLSFFVGMCVFCYFNPAAVSESERRPFAQFPEKITWEGVMDKTIINDFEDYSVDQFPFREFFRSLKAKVQIYVLRLSENNGLAVKIYCENRTEIHTGVRGLFHRASSVCIRDAAEE